MLHVSIVPIGNLLHGCPAGFNQTCFLELPFVRKKWHKTMLCATCWTIWFGTMSVPPPHVSRWAKLFSPMLSSSNPTKRMTMRFLKRKLSLRVELLMDERSRVFRWKRLGFVNRRSRICACFSKAHIEINLPILFKHKAFKFDYKFQNIDKNGFHRT